MKSLKNGQREKESSRLCDSMTIRILIMGMILGMCAVPVWAESDKGKHRHDPKAKLERMTKRLALTEDQRAKILPILEEKHQKMQALHEQMKETRQQAMAKVDALLTPEQQEKNTQHREARKNKMKEYRDKHGKGHKKRKHGKDEAHE